MCVCVCVCVHVNAKLSETPWTEVCQPPPSMRFPRQEYWSGLSYPSAGIFPTQGLNLNLLLGRWILLPLSHQKSTVCVCGGVNVCVCISHFLYPCIYQWRLILCSHFSYCEKCYNEYEKTNLFQILISILFDIYPEAELLKHMISRIFSFFEKPPHCFHSGSSISHSTGLHSFPFSLHPHQHLFFLTF